MKPKFDYENFIIDTYLRWIKYRQKKEKLRRKKKHDSKRSATGN